MARREACSSAAFLVHAAGAGAGDDDAVHAGHHQRVDDGAACTGVAGDDLHRGPGSSVVRQGRGRGVGNGRRQLTKALQCAVAHQPEHAGVAGAESGDAPAMLLAHLRRGEHLAAQHREHAAQRRNARQRDRVHHRAVKACIPRVHG